MNPLIKALSELANLQRDKILKPEPAKIKKKKNTGFAEILREEERKRNGLSTSNRTD